MPARSAASRSGEGSTRHEAGRALGNHHHVDLAALPERIEAPERAEGVVLYFRLKGMVLGIAHELAGAFPLTRGDLARVAARATGDTAALLLATGLRPARPSELGAIWDGRPIPEGDVLDRLGALIETQRPPAPPADPAPSAGPALSTSPALSASVVICTRDRPRDLADCLDSLAAEIAGGRDVVVVDNGPDAATEAVVRACQGVRYAVAARPGLSHARNVGVVAAKGDVVVFVDDDVRPEPGWIAPLVAAFAPGIDVVCGLVLPEALETEAQIAFQLDLGFGGMGFVPLLHDRAFLEAAEGSPPVWEIGAGANMAVRRARVLELGGFDERVGPGAAGGCGDDSEYWHRVLHGGGGIVYEPRSVVRHRHRRDWPALDRQAYGYGLGHVAALFAQYGRSRDRRDLIRALATMPAWLLRRGAKAPLLALLGRPDRLAAPWIRGYAAALRHLPLAMRVPPPPPEIAAAAARNRDV